MKFYSWALLGASTATAVIIGRRLWSEFVDNSIKVSILEQVTLPPDSTESCTELSVNVSGEIQVETHLLYACKFALKCNARIRTQDEELVSGSAGSRQGRSTTESGWTRADPSDRSDEHRSTTAPSSSSSQQGPVLLRHVVMNDICDLCRISQTNVLEFSPASSSSFVFMRYETTLNDHFFLPVAMKQCWVQPADTPNAHKLTFDLFILKEVFDVSVDIAFPKRAKLHHVNTGGVGTMARRVGAASDTDMTWTVGSISETGLVQPSSAGAAPTASPNRTLPDDTLRPDDLDDMGRRLRVISFEAVYINEDGANATSLMDDTMVSATESRVSRVTNKSQSSEPRIVLPGISVMYNCATTASGLSIRRLTTKSPKKNWEPSSDLLRRFMEKFAERRLVKNYSVTTTFTQVVRAQPHF